jgi:hypothetical protein
MARLQTFHARVIPKTASTILCCIAASLFHILVPANGLSILGLCVKALQLSWHLAWCFWRIHFLLFVEVVPVW